MRLLSWKDMRIALPARYKVSREDGQVLGIWLILRLITVIWAAGVASQSKPVQLDSSYPEGAAGATWIERTLLAPWERWDVTFYVRIVRHGYRADDGTASFHPLLAWLAAPLAWVSGRPLLALFLVSSLASALLLLAFERLARLDLSLADARTATLLLAFAPMAFVLFAPYTEGLFLLWAVLCLFWARQGRWWWAGLAGALATLTRQQGVFLLIPLAWELWEAADRRWPNARRAWRDWLALAFIPAGLLVWLVYRALVLNDLQANLRDPQTLIFSLLISSSTNKIVPVQMFLWPWQALGLALQTFIETREYSLLIDLVLGAGFVVLLAAAWRRMRWSYRLYALAILLVSFSYHTGSPYPYIALPRHLLLAFPVFIGLGPLFQGRWSRLLMIAGGLCGMLILLSLYEVHGWVP